MPVQTIPSPTLPPPASPTPSRMLAARAPYAVEPTLFRFPALAAAAGRAPLGGERETALAAYLAARLADDATHAAALPLPVRAQRAAAARSWLASLALPAAVRKALVRVLDASEMEGAALPDGLLAALQGVTSITADVLPAAAHSDLATLAAAIRERASGH